MGLTKNDIIAGLYTDKDIDNAIKKMQPFELQDDLRQEMFMVLCEMDEAKFMSMHNGGFLKFYLVRTMLSMIKSDRSTFFNKFRRVFTEWTEKHDAPDVSDTIQTDEITVKLNNSLKILHWYELEILRLYSENGQNIMSLSRDTGIPYRSLMKTIKKTKTLLKYKIKNHAIT
jgi:hypothetical protein